MPQPVQQLPVGLSGAYGFKDAFNLSLNPVWYDTDYLGIDQGPIVIMIENYRTGRGVEPLHAERRRPDGPGARRLHGRRRRRRTRRRPRRSWLAWSQPNPFTRATTIRFRLPAAGPVRLDVFDLAGRQVARLLDETRPAGEQAVAWEPGALATGVYYVRLEAAGRTVAARCVKLR